MDEDRLDAVMRSSMDGIMALRAVRSATGDIVDFEFTDINDVGAEIIGLPTTEIIGARLRELWPPVEIDELFHQYASIAREHSEFVHEWRFDTDGGERWFALSAVGVPEPGDGVVVTFRETTEHRRFTGIISELQDRHKILQRQALHDPLTGLSNRLLLDSQLEHAVNRLVRHDSSVAVLFLDLDGFKTINDTHGHKVGDAALVQIARRLQQVARPYDTVSRIGGDEFVIVCEDLDSADDVMRISHRYIQACAEPILADGVEVAVTASIGVAIADRGQEDVRDLVAEADEAMYRAKARGGGQVEFADRSVGKRSARRLEADNRLERAIADDAFELRFEPILRGSDRRVAAAEVQLDWPSGRDGDEDPCSVGDETLADLLADPATPVGAVVEVGYHAVRAAVDQMRSWHLDMGDPHIVLVVNVHLALLAEPDFVDRVLALVEASGVSADRLCLGVPEYYFSIDDVDLAFDTLSRLDAAGIMLQRCGVGAGSAPAHYVRRFPISYAKLDRRLVESASRDDEILAIIHDLARTRGATVVASGVTHQEHFDALLHLGTELFQGPFISDPLPLRGFEAFVLQQSGTLRRALS